MSAPAMKFPGFFENTNPVRRNEAYANPWIELTDVLYNAYFVDLYVRESNKLAQLMYQNISSPPVQV